MATNVGASFSPNADRLQRRPLLTKPIRMGKHADAATCFQDLPNPNPDPCQSAYKYWRNNWAVKLVIQIAKGKLYRILRGTYKTASPWPPSFLCYQIYIFQRFLRRSRRWSATYLTTRTAEEVNIRQAVSRQKGEEEGRGGVPSKMDKKELGIRRRKPLRKEDQGEVSRNWTMRSCTRKAGSKRRRRSWTRSRTCGFTWWRAGGV